MAFTATIKAASAANGAITVLITYADTVTGFTLDEAFTLPVIGDVLAQGKDYIQRRGAEIRAAQVQTAALLAAVPVGTSITIR